VLPPPPPLLLLLMRRRGSGHGLVVGGGLGSGARQIDRLRRPLGYREKLVRVVVLLRSNESTRCDSSKGESDTNRAYRKSRRFYFFPTRYIHDAYIKELKRRFAESADRRDCNFHKSTHDSFRTHCVTVFPIAPHPHCHTERTTNKLINN
jgi:hypothetical protein